MLYSAKYIKNELESHNVLEKAYANFPEYNLVITGIKYKLNNLDFLCQLLMFGYIWYLGHSLGAGTAVLLAFYMRPLYPNLKVYAFATPGNKNNYYLYYVYYLKLT